MWRTVEEHLESTERKTTINENFIVSKKKALKTREKPRYILKKNENIHPHKNVYIAELFIIAKKWKPPKCLSTKTWINEMWYNHGLKY